jgi:hypothetical protein
MATTNWDLVQVYQISKPKTFRALQNLFVAAKKAIKSTGKKGLFGGDKEATTRKAAIQCILAVQSAMDADGHDSSLIALQLEVAQFSITFPNWPEEREYVDWLIEKLGE